MITGDIHVNFLMSDLDVSFIFTTTLDQLVTNDHEPSDSELKEAIYNLVRSTSFDIEDMTKNLRNKQMKQLQIIRIIFKIPRI